MYWFIIVCLIFFSNNNFGIYFFVAVSEWSKTLTPINILHKHFPATFFAEKTFFGKKPNEF